MVISISEHFSSSDFILVVTVLVSGICFYSKQYFYSLALHPHSVFKGMNRYQIVTSGFIHSSWSHLMVNMFFLYYWGNPLESKMEMHSENASLHFLIFYLVGILLGNGATVILKRKNYGFTSIGSSGSILGVMLCYLVFVPTGHIIHLPLIDSVPNWIMVLVYYLGSLYSIAKPRNGTINYHSHFYGATGNIACLIIFYPESLRFILRN